ncbi:hypothetical protein LEMLEM_LOCUS14170 [Lemmus lemmus]
MFPGHIVWESTEKWRDSLTLRIMEGGSVSQHSEKHV